MPTANRTCCRNWRSRSPHYGGPAYDAAFDRDSSDLRGIAPAFLYRTDRVELLPAAGDPVLGGDPAIVYAVRLCPHNSDVSNPKTLNAVLPAGVTACETSWVFPRAPVSGSSASTARASAWAATVMST